MSALPGETEIRSARLITEAEWRQHRLDSLALAPEAFAAAGGLPDVLLPYQRTLLALTAAHPVTVVEKSRRTGVTWAAGADAVLRAAATRGSGGMDALYIGYNLDMAREFIDTCTMWARAFAQAVTAAGVAEFLFDDADPNSPGETRQIQAFRIRFASGHEIVALASRPRSLRGRQGYVVIDEAAFHDDLPSLLQAALALLIWGGKVLVISTHNGTENPYNKLIQEVRGGQKPYALLRVDFDQGLDQGLYHRICLVTGATWSPEAEAAWRASIIAFYGGGADEELFCIPSEGGGAWLPAPLIAARARAGIPVLRLKREPSFTHWSQGQRHGDILRWSEAELLPVLRALDPALSHYLGGDYGRVSDLTVLWVLARQRTTRMTTALVVELRGVPFDCQAIVQDYVMDRLPRFVASNHDATGLGMSIAEHAVQRYGQSTSEATMLNAQFYREQMQPLKTAFESDWIDIPADADIQSDLALLLVKAGVPQVPALRSGVRKDRHGDAAIALALAHYASRRKLASFGYESVRTLRETDPDAADDLFGPQIPRALD